jgi:glycosyltransferase involved in cell wall biosynthesis
MEGRHLKPRIAVLATLAPNGEKGGAERLFGGVCDALNAAGATAELIETCGDESNFATIRESYLRHYDLDLARYDGVISMKGPAYVARHRNHVCYLMHTMRAFYDMFDSAFPRCSPRHVELRRLIFALDTSALQRPRALFAIGHEVAARLHRYNGLDATVLRPPSSLLGLHQGRFRYMFLPGRLHPWKRIDLAIDAMKFAESPVELIISGCGADEARLRDRAAGQDRIRFIGRVSDVELVDLYADALGVIFAPRSEDLGLVTLEAFQSGKPVITCSDSGEPARIVCDGRSGFVCAPDPRAIAAGIDQLASQPRLAAEMGQFGKASVASITWQRVANTLLSALDFRELALPEGKAA